MAPEIFTGVYENKVDLWACGVVLFETLSGGQMVILICK